MVDGILRPLGAVIGGVMNAWVWTTRGTRLHALLLTIIPRVLGDQALTVPQLARRAAADTLWPYGAIPQIAMSRALDELVAAGTVVGPIVGADAEERYTLAATAPPQDGDADAMVAHR
jgi:hypothetical protein